MAVKDREKIKSVYTPQEVRNLLKIDNKEIVNLCKEISLIPKKNNKGQTYFLSDEVKKMQKAKKAKETEKAKSSKSTELALSENIQPVKTPSEAVTLMSKDDSDKFINNVLSKLQNMEQTLTEKVSSTIDEKLDGMDEVVVELIRCKSENETLRQKINELNKQNYHLKNEVSSYKLLGFGLYVKKNTDDFSI